MTNGNDGYALCLELEPALARAFSWPVGLGAKRGGGPRSRPGHTQMS